MNAQKMNIQMGMATRKWPLFWNTHVTAPPGLDPKTGQSSKAVLDGLSHALLKAGVGLTAEQGAVTVKGSISGVVGEEANSSGISGLLSLGYRF